MKLEIVTPYGNRYIVHENAEIERGDMPGPWAKWLFLGLSHSHPFNGEFVPFTHVVEYLKKDPNRFSTYKNGNPRYTVRDLDHGTMREWGNTKYHGVKNIRIIE